MKRYKRLDEIRGFTLLSMILYHMMWDLVYLSGMDVIWYRTGAGYLWQQSICWTFLLLSGFCFPLGRRKLKRGLTVSAAGLLVTAVTCTLMPEDRVVFGVLTLLGFCMLLMIPAEGILRGRKPLAGMAVSLFLFVMLRNVNQGVAGFESFRIVRLPQILYRNLFTAFLGFPYPEFFSTDYFSVIPWIFLFVFGYYLHYFVKERGLFSLLEGGGVKPAEWLGRHSLEIYLLHQPILMLGLRLFRLV